MFNAMELVNGEVKFSRSFEKKDAAIEFLAEMAMAFYDRDIEDGTYTEEEISSDIAIGAFEDDFEHGAYRVWSVVPA